MQVIQTEKNNEVSIVFYNHKDINDFKDSVKSFHHTEYQCHYFALVRTEIYNKFKIHLIFPLVYYNYEQKVSSASVDTNMKIINKEAQKLVPLVNEQAKLLKLYLNNSLQPYNKNIKQIKYSISFFNNIHKHP